MEDAFFGVDGTEDTFVEVRGDFIAVEGNSFVAVEGNSFVVDESSLDADGL